MDKFSSYVYGWNEWVVTPIILILAILFYIRSRDTWHLLIAGGLVLSISSQFLYLLFPIPTHEYYPGLIMSAIGFVIVIVGSIWGLVKKKKMISK
jgi:hypothetical protein